MLSCLTLSIIRYVSRVKWSNPGKGVATSPTPRCCSYRKGSLRVTLDYGRQLYLLTMYNRERLNSKRRNLNYICSHNYISNVPLQLNPGNNTPLTSNVYGHQPLIIQTIPVRRRRHAILFLRNKNVLLWIPGHRLANVGRSAKIYMGQLCVNTGCC